MSDGTSRSKNGAVGNQEEDLEQGNTEEEGDWIEQLDEDKIKQLKRAYETGRFNPVQEILGERTAIASDLTSTDTDKGKRKDKNWFRRMIRSNVYVSFKFLCLKDRRYDSKFCNDVFSAIGIPKNEDEWDSVYRQAERSINELRAMDSIRVKESFDSK